MDGANKNLIGLLLLAALLAALSGCSRPGTTAPEAEREPADGPPSVLSTAGADRNASPGQGWRLAERQKDCDAVSTWRTVAGTTVDFIKYAWQDCDGDGTEDQDGDTYTADYGEDGATDRRVIYRQDETTVEYYSARGGDLPVFAWFVSGDKWHLTDFSYSQVLDQWESQHIAGYVCMQKLSRLNNQWYPFSESPFCFFDSDGDAAPEAALRFCTLYDPGQDANSYSLIWTPLEFRPRPLLSAFRLSFDLENDADQQAPYSYSLSLTVELLDPVDEAPYLRPLVTQYGRRLNFIPKEAALELAYDLLTGRLPARKRVGLAHEIVSSGRWEGVIWYQDGLHKIRNAGGPGTRENRLQDFLNLEAGPVRLYASKYDGLVHLFGAQHSIIRQRQGNIIYSDSNGDGYAELVEDGDGVHQLGLDSFTDLSVEDLFEAAGLAPPRR